MSYLASNNAVSTLAVSLGGTGGDTTLQIQAADVSKFPVINQGGVGSDYTMLTLVNAAGDMEIVKATRHDTAAASFTVVRGQEGTTIRAWLIGDSVSCRLTAGVVTQTYTHPDQTTGAHAASAIAVTPVGTLVATQAQAALAELDSKKATKVDPSVSGSITLTGASFRMIGDFSNATPSARPMVQASSDGATHFHVVGKGAGAGSGIKMEVGDYLLTGNASMAGLDIVPGSSFSIASSIRGAGTYLPMVFATGGSERMRINTNGALQVGSGSATGAVGSTDPLNLVSSGAADLRLRWYQTSVEEWSLGMQSGSGALSFRQGNGGLNERMQLTAAGVLNLKANGAANFSHSFTYNENGGEINLNDNTGANRLLIDVVSGSTRVLHMGATGDMSIGINGATTGKLSLLRAGGIEGLQIDASGNVGINGAPQSALTKLTVTSGRSAFIAGAEPFSVQVQYSSSSGQYYMGASNSASPDLVFSNASGVEKFRFGNSGQLGIGGANYGTAGQVLMSGGAGVAPSWSSSASGIGVGQAYQNLTGSRALGTVYTNTTGKPILVSVTGVITSNTTTGSLTPTVGGVALSAYSVGEAGPSVWGGLYNSVPFVVPDGATYSVAGSNANLTNWSELR